jgi:hypothetical protein
MGVKIATSYDPQVGRMLGIDEPPPEADPSPPSDDQGNGHHDDRHVVLTAASEIKPRRVQWLWADRMALGTLALLAGREGLGKSI